MFTHLLLALASSLATSNADPTRVYTISLNGTFGREVAPEPVREAMDEARKQRAQVVLVRFDSDYLPETADSTTAADDAWDQLELARRITPLLTEPPKGTSHPRLVFWIKEARAGAGLLTFVCPEIYYTSDGVHDCILNGMVWTSGHGRSLRLGRAQGLALKGGHQVEVFNAMVRLDYVLSVNFLDGKLEFHEDMSGGTVLTDENDSLILTPDLAIKLGFSRGTADTDAALFEQMKLNPAEIERVGDSDTIFKKWHADLLKAEEEIPKLRRQFNDLQIAAPGGYDERAAARQERTRLVKLIIEKIDRFDDSLNERTIGEPTKTLREWAEDAVKKLEEQQKLDRRG